MSTFPTVPPSGAAQRTREDYLSAGFSPAMAEYFMTGRKRPVHVVPEDDFTLRIAFYNGEIRRLDMKPHLQEGKAFAPLKDAVRFKRVYIAEGGSISWDIDSQVDSSKVWNNVIDLCPDCCYVNSIAVSPQQALHKNEGGVFTYA